MSWADDLLAKTAAKRAERERQLAIRQKEDADREARYAQSPAALGEVAGEIATAINAIADVFDGDPDFDQEEAAQVAAKYRTVQHLDP